MLAPLLLDTTGEYSFRAPPGFHLRIDNALLSQAAVGGVRVQLARGNHALELAGNSDGIDPLRLEWRPSGVADWQPISTQFLFTGPHGGTGLQLTLVSGTDWSAEPSEVAVDPVLSHYYHVSPFSRVHLEPKQWIAGWNGQVEVPASGSYGFSLDHSQMVSRY